MAYTIHATDIVGYTFCADIYCPDCIIRALPTNVGGAFEGWGMARGVLSSTEDNLSELAHAFRFNRKDETTFDSGDFPKVIFASDAEDETCGDCYRPLLGD